MKLTDVVISLPDRKIKDSHFGISVFFSAWLFKLFANIQSLLALQQEID